MAGRSGKFAGFKTHIVSTLYAGKLNEIKGKMHVPLRAGEQPCEGIAPLMCCNCDACLIVG
jgi:hypothetical protein